MKSRIVMLGSSGFIGSALLKRLRESRSVSVEGYGSRTLNLAGADAADRLADILDDRTVLIVTVYPRRAGDAFAAVGEDVVIAANIARSLSRKPVLKCVYLSSLAVYGHGETNLAITEEARIAPTSLYGIGKFAGETVVRQVTEKAGISTVVLRPCMVYGPGDNSGAYGPAQFMDSLLRTGEIRIYGDGQELRDYVFVDDLAEIVCRFVFEELSGTYNVGTGESHSFQEIIAHMRKIAPRQFVVTSLRRDKPKVDEKIDIARLLRAVPGFEFTRLEEGLLATFRGKTAQEARAGQDDGRN